LGWFGRQVFKIVRVIGFEELWVTSLRQPLNAETSAVKRLRPAKRIFTDGRRLVLFIGSRA